LAVAFVIRDYVPNTILIPWAAAQISVALLSMVRWNRFQHIDDSAPNAHTLIVEAVAWKAVAGALWGALALFSNFHLPQSLEFFTAIAVAAVAVGGVSTMSAIPKAVYAFILLSFTPFIVFWLISNDNAYVTLGLLAILMLGVILNSARVAHNQLLSVLQAEVENKQISDEFDTARGEWLDLADTTESYVVFDAQDRLIAWNKRFVELMKPPADLLRRGTSRLELIKGSRQAVEVTSGEISIDHWMRLRADAKNNQDDTATITEFEGGLWIQRRHRHSKNGHLVVSHIDVTNVVNAETALQESEERYRAIAENSPDAIFVRVEDTIVFANPAAVKLLRADSDADLVGSSMLSLYHPGDHNQVLGNRAKLNQDPDEQPPLVRARMRRLDGTYVMTEGSGTNHIWQGQPAVMAIRRDITDQIEANERLRESEQRYRRIADLSPVAILIRVEDRIVYANPAAIKMFAAESEADLLYESTMSLVHPDDLYLVENNRAMMTADMEGAAPSIKVRRRRLDGTYFYCEGSGAPFVWQGQPAVMLMWRDITNEIETDRPLLESA
jgi:PAS domain S-box-containing protein